MNFIKRLVGDASPRILWSLGILLVLLLVAPPPVGPLLCPRRVALR